MSDRVTSGDPLWDERFTLIPNLLLNHYIELGITDVELVFLFHLIKRAWWDKEDAFPLYNTIAKEMGKTKGTIMRIARNLSTRTWREKNKEGKIVAYRGKGYIEIIPQMDERGDSTSNLFSFKPLNDTLRKIALQKRKEGGSSRNDTTPSSKNDTTPSSKNDTTPSSKEINQGQSKVSEFSSGNRRILKQTNHETTTDPAQAKSVDSSVVVPSASPQTTTDVVVEKYNEQARQDYSKGLASSWAMMVTVLHLIDSNKPPQDFFYELLGKFSYEDIFAQINAMRVNGIKQPDNLRGWFKASLEGNWDLKNITEEERIEERAREEVEATRRETLEFREEAKIELERWGSLSPEEKAEEKLQRRASFMKAMGTPLSEAQKEELRKEYIAQYRGDIIQYRGEMMPVG